MGLQLSAPVKLNLEMVLTHPKLFGLTTASPLQRAICRVAQGLPLDDLLERPEVVEALGGANAALALNTLPEQPKELIILSAIRTGKSLFTSALAVFASQTCNFDGLGPGEIPRVSVLSLTKNHAKVVLDHLIGRVKASPILKGLVIGEPKGDSIFLRHPSGQEVEVCVVPIDRAGGSVVARWSAGCIMDEAPRMQSQADGILNYDDVRKSVMERLRPGAQLVSVGSPWAPRGSIFETVSTRWGKPTKNLVVIKAPGPAMNPFWWTPERVENSKRNQTVYQTDVLAEFADPDSTLFTNSLINQCTRQEPMHLPPLQTNEYMAAMDPATRANSWPLVIITQEGGIKKVAFCKQWQSNKHTPLDPEDILKEIAGICWKYNQLRTVASDQWSGDVLNAVARRHGLSVAINTIDKTMRFQMFDNLYKNMLDGKVELPPDPLMRADLMAVRKKVTTAGVDIVLPRTGDGRHADYAFALALAMWYYVDDPVPVGPRPGTVEWIKLQELISRSRILNGEKDKDGLDTQWWSEYPQEY